MSTLKELLGAGGGGHKTGELVEASSLALTVPDYLPCDGKIYLASTYPDLFPLMPPVFPDAKLTNPSTLPTSTGRGTSFSPDGAYLAVAHATSPFITIYKRSGDTFTKLADPSILPPGTGYGTAFSTDGAYLAVAHATSPFITIYYPGYDRNTQFKLNEIPSTDGYKKFIKT
jgi:hypothetical protein